MRDFIIAFLITLGASGIGAMMLVACHWNRYHKHELGGDE